jgi:putative endonuclease
VTESAKQLPELKKRVLSALQQRQHNFSLGAAGEARAARYLISLGYEVLAENTRYKNSEIDIIAFDTKSQELVFVEVKTRSSAGFGHPSKAVTKAKIFSLQKVARMFCKQYQVAFDYRFDTISVLPNAIEHFKNITWAL